MTWVLSSFLLCVGIAMMACGFKFWHGEWTSLIAGLNAPQKDVDTEKNRKAIRYVSILTFAAGAAMTYSMASGIAIEFGFLDPGFDTGIITQAVFGFIVIASIIGLVSVNRKK